MVIENIFMYIIDQNTQIFNAIFKKKKEIK